MLQKQKGVAMLSTLISLPVLGLLLGGAIQVGLLYQAEAVLDHAADAAARAGATKNASAQSISDGLAHGLLPLYVGSKSYVDMKSRLLSRVKTDVNQFTCIRIVNPTPQAIHDHDVTPADPVRDNTISLYELSTLPDSPGSSGLSIQDAMILKVHIVYGARAEVPIVGPLIASALSKVSGVSGATKRMLENRRIPIEAAGIAHMQSSAILNGLMGNTGC